VLSNVMRDSGISTLHFDYSSSSFMLIIIIPFHSMLLGKNKIDALNSVRFLFK
jgi:hypothetical protein